MAKDNMKEIKRDPKKIAFLGHFGQGYNFGNESTLRAILYHLRRLSPDPELTCICTGPQAVAATHKITAFQLALKSLKGGKVSIGMPTEFYRWPKAFWTLRGKDMFIIPGTALLTDTYGLFRFAWGPITCSNGH